MVFPVVLGEGKGIFDGSRAAGSLRLTEHVVSDKGVAFLSYEPAGDVPTGSFATNRRARTNSSCGEKIERGQMVTPTIRAFEARPTAAAALRVTCRSAGRSRKSGSHTTFTWYHSKR